MGCLEVIRSVSKRIVGVVLERFKTFGCVFAFCCLLRGLAYWILLGVPVFSKSNWVLIRFSGVLPGPMAIFGFGV